MKLIFFFLILTLFISCSSTTYFYSTMNSDDPFTLKNTNGEFIQKGDSIDVIYNFNGENAPVTVGVNNKMSKSVYIDWRKSGLVINNQKIFFRDSLDTGTMEDYADRSLNDAEGMSTLKEKMKLNTQILELTNFNFHKLPKSQFKKRRNKENNINQDESGLYTEMDSPIYIETFLTIYSDTAGITDPLIFESSFYLLEVIKSKDKNPLYLTDDQKKRGDFFYVVKVNGENWKKAGNTSLKILGKTAVVTGDVILWALGDERYQ